MTSEVHPTQQACLEAIDRIARTPDGATLYVYLQRRLMSITPTDSDGALRLDEGERRFASKLIGLMAKGIFESGGRTGSHDGTSGGPSGAEQPIVVPSPQPVRVAGPGSSRRRITADTIVPGWNDTPGGDDAA